MNDSTTNDQIVNAARAVREDLAEELAELAAMHAPTSRPGVALSTDGDPVLMITITPELGAALAQLLHARRRPIGDRLPARHLLALRAWVEGGSVVIEWKATHAIEVREVRCAKPCAIRAIEIVRPDATRRVVPMWIAGGELRTQLVPSIHVATGETIKVTLATPAELDPGTAWPGEADLFYEPIP